MNLCELRDLTKNQNLSQEDLDVVTPMYIALDLHKNDFCKIVKALGVEKIAEKANKWDFMIKAHDFYSAKLQYERKVARLAALEREMAELQADVEHYENYNNIAPTVN
ncbi:MAG: hypothetical protein FWG64_02775 [Firmicutes bacterium]|nr:hypothetical protein [Bacillota bacterium]